MWPGVFVARLLASLLHLHEAPGEASLARLVFSRPDAQILGSPVFCFTLVGLRQAFLSSVPPGTLL